MKRKECIVLFVLVLTAGLFPPQTEASIFISEILADPASGSAGDANGDGVTSSTKDEFVELYNGNDFALDLSGWSISDKRNTRHVFTAGSLINPYAYLAVFGGGVMLPEKTNWKASSTGSLSLNNSGDTVSLWDSESGLIDEVVYGRIGGRDKSIVRLESGDWGLITDSGEGEGLYFSPGSGIYSAPELPPPGEGGDEGEANAVVPEPATMIMMLMGAMGMILVNPKRHLSFSH